MSLESYVMARIEIEWMLRKLTRMEDEEDGEE